MRRHILKCALFCMALTATSLYGLDQPQTGAPSSAAPQQMFKDGQGGIDEGEMPMMNQGFGQAVQSTGQMPDISATQIVKEISNDGPSLILDNGLVLRPSDRKGADLIASLFKSGDQISIKFTHRGLFVKPMNQDHFIKVSVWEVHPVGITVTNINGRNFQLSDNSNWRAGFLAQHRVFKDLKSGTAVVPVQIQSQFGRGPHALLFFNDAQGHPQSIVVRMLSQPQQAPNQ